MGGTRVAVRLDDVLLAFGEVFEGGAAGILFVRAPGRVNLLGEHTDYTGGLVLPIALDLDVVIGFRPREDSTVRLYSVNHGQLVEFATDDEEYDPQDVWSNYFRGVSWVMAKNRIAERSGRRLRGLDAAVKGDVPEGAGLGSSAAFSVASAMALLAAAGVLPADGSDGWAVSRLEIARLCQEAENEFVGVRCGIMDQVASLLGRCGSAVFLDCRSMECEVEPLPFDGARLVICDTGVRRGLARSEYNRRREECEAGARAIRNLTGRESIRTLRDVRRDEFERVGGFLPNAVARRCAHVMGENERVTRGVRALRRGDVEEFGLLMNESHESLRDLYEVSCEALDAMVESARAIEGVLGSRMTGGGFGGCTISLVRKEALPAFMAEVVPRYQARLRSARGRAKCGRGRALVDRGASAFAVAPADGARFDRLHSASSR